MQPYMIRRCALAFCIGFWLVFALAVNSAYPADLVIPKRNPACYVQGQDGPRNAILKDDLRCKSHLRWVPLPR